MCKTSKGNSKNFWSHFHHLSTKGAKSSLCNNNFTADDINNYFCLFPAILFNLYHQLPSVSPLSYLHDARDTTFQISAVGVDDTVSVLSNLDSAKATGCDGLPVKFLKACPLAMGRLLTKVINQSISSHSFPNLWKHAVVRILKVASSALTNFCPISVLPVFSKVLERVIHNQLVLYFVKYYLFSPYQSSFYPSHSTQDVLLYVADSWHKAVDAHKFVISGFLDLAKAFDCVNDIILLDRLSHYGVVGDSHTWFKSYLCVDNNQ